MVGCVSPLWNVVSLLFFHTSLGSDGSYLDLSHEFSNQSWTVECPWISVFIFCLVGLCQWVSWSHATPAGSDGSYLDLSHEFSYHSSVGECLWISVFILCVVGLVSFLGKCGENLSVFRVAPMRSDRSYSACPVNPWAILLWLRVCRSVYWSHCMVGSVSVSLLVSFNSFWEWWILPWPVSWVLKPLFIRRVSRDQCFHALCGWVGVSFEECG